MNCLHCYTRNSDEKLGIEAFDYVENFAKSGVMQVHFGGGESLMRDDFLPVVDEVHKSGMGVSLSTNGSLMTKKLAKGLENKVNMVGLSIHGATASTHDSFTRYPGAFSKLLRAHKALRNINHRFIVVLCSKTAPEAVGIIRLASDLGISVEFRTMKNVGNALEHELKLSPVEEKEIREVILMEADNHVGIEISFDKEVICACGRFTIAVRANGDVTACSLAVDPIGNLKDDLLIDLWQNHPKLIELRRSGISPCKL